MIAQHFEQLQSRIQNILENYLPSEKIPPAQLHQAMRYSVLQGGKRLRPLLVYVTGTVLGASLEDLDGPACAVELIHAYSLIHDDLPAMDDDALRRGQATCHIAFGEATAILAGDVLQSLAFEILATHPYQRITADRCVEMIAILAKASGSQGMGGGQALDLAASSSAIALPALQTLHHMKTGALIEACVQLGALCAPKVNAAQHTALQCYAKALGLAFQIHDDILDIEMPTTTLGKPQGSDLASGKTTYPSLLGLENAKHAATQRVTEALSALADLPYNTDPLATLAQYVITRNH